MNLKLIYRKENEGAFVRNWQIIVSQKEADFRYYPENIEMLLTLSKERGYFKQDESFVCLVDNRVVGGVFLLAEQGSQGLTGSTSLSYLPAPLVLDGRVEKDVFNIIEETAIKNKFSKLMFALDPLDFSEYNYLQSYGYLDTSILSYVIKLGGDLDLLQECRRGHKCDIKHILRDDNYQIFFMDAANLSRDIFDEYVYLHHKCAGKVTRSKESFDCQFESIKNNRGFLVGLQYQDKNIAYCNFEYSGTKAMYYSGVDDPEYVGAPLYHALIYKAMLYLQDKKVKYLDMGQPASPSNQLDYYLDEKQKNIALFKRGFPGSFAPFYRGIKYFDKNTFQADVNIFQESYIK